MVEPRSFHNHVQSVDTQLDNGTKVCLRRVSHSDRDLIEKGISEMSDESRYLRFFSGAKTMPPSVIERLASVDGVLHLAWGMVNMEDDSHPAMAVAHVFRETEDSDTGEFAIGVLDQYHGLGVARMVMTAIFLDSYCEGLRNLRIEVLHSNKKASGLMRAVGATQCALEGFVGQYNLVIADAISALQKMESPKAIPDIVAAFAAD